MTLEKMGQYTIDEMIGQMLIVGFDGLILNENDKIINQISKGLVGGVILFEKNLINGNTEKNIKNPEQLQQLINSLKKNSKIPLFISIDQEGGQVARLNENNGFYSSFSQKYLGKINDIELTRKYSRNMSKILFDLGINLNFAPVVDLNLNIFNPVIGAKERSFSSDSKKVYELSKIIIEEHKNNNVYCVIKHFPGHGSANQDSHIGFVDVTNCWKEVELEPFKLLIDNNKVNFIMTAHIFNSTIDVNYPATLSYNTINVKLRNELNYQGIVVSDDMGMAAITDNYTLEKSIELAINASVDVLVFGNNLNYDDEIILKVHSIIKKLVIENKIKFSRIEESFQRILKAKNGLNNN